MRSWNSSAGSRFPGSPRITGWLAALALSAGVAASQSSSPASSTASAPARAKVDFEAGMLTVTAKNSSLNSVIHDIARTTGMKISGRVPEDRVFGTYGPADPQVVLSTLLDGTGINTMIVSNDADKPLQLVLTPRTGGATPPDANAESADTGDDADAQPVASAPQITGGRINRARAPGPQPQSAPAATSSNQPSEVTQPVIFPPIGATSTPSTATTTPVDPDNDSDPSTEHVKTPQQIFEQLQKLQQGTPQDPQSQP